MKAHNADWMNKPDVLHQKIESGELIIEAYALQDTWAMLVDRELLPPEKVTTLSILLRILELEGRIVREGNSPRHFRYVAKGAAHAE